MANSTKQALFSFHWIIRQQILNKLIQQLIRLKGKEQIANEQCNLLKASHSIEIYSLEIFSTVCLFIWLKKNLGESMTSQHKIWLCVLYIRDKYQQSIKNVLT